MGIHNEDQLPAGFIGDFADIPDVPGHLYGRLRHGIDRRVAVRRTLWAVAASLIIMVTAFSVAHLSRPQIASVAEAEEELSTVDSYINSNVYTEDDNSYVYYEETLYQE
jgi:hypothetical protein